jgi:hypothetical protein
LIAADTLQSDTGQHAQFAINELVGLYTDFHLSTRSTRAIAKSFKKFYKLINGNKDLRFDTHIDRLMATRIPQAPVAEFSVCANVLCKKVQKPAAICSRCDQRLTNVHGMPLESVAIIPIEYWLRLFLRNPEFSTHVLDPPIIDAGKRSLLTIVFLMQFDPAFSWLFCVVDAIFTPNQASTHQASTSDI